jgi:hypothetical protein
MSIVTWETLARRDNVQVSHDSKKACRSECVVAIDPGDPSRRIVASKIFPDFSEYQFWLATCTSDDGGDHWHGSQADPPRPGDWINCGDPAMMFDDTYAFLVGNPQFKDGSWGVCCYRSDDHGSTWEDPVVLHVGPVDDKPACAGDAGRNSLYVTWDTTSGGLAFARSSDHGVSWQGIGGEQAGSLLAGGGQLSAIAVTASGTLHVFSVIGPDVAAQQPGRIVVNTSSDGGVTFGAATTVASSIGHLAQQDYETVPFRSLTLPACCASGDRLAVAWTDIRDGPMRTYYRTGTSGVDGLHWDGPGSGQLLTASDHEAAGDHDCQPQLAALDDGTVACSFYRYHTPASGPAVVNPMTCVCPSLDEGFEYEIRTSSKAWDPKVRLVHDHLSPDNGFVGDYFGLSGADGEFQVVWTDTRTGRQELFTTRVRLESKRIVVLPESGVQILFGVVQDGGGVVYTPAGAHRIGPRGPIIDLLKQAQREFEAEHPSQREA